MMNKNLIFENNDKKMNLTKLNQYLFLVSQEIVQKLVETIITSGKEKIYNAGENFILQKALQKSQVNKKINESKKFIKLDISFLKKDIVNSYMRKFSILTENLSSLIEQ